MERKEPKSTRDAYGDALLELGQNDKVVVIDADLSVSTQTNKFAKKYPGRFFNVGCAEQNLMGVAAGFAISGKVPFASTYSMFLMRGLEQIRNTIGYDNLNVKLCVTHSGLTNSSDGASHQCLEDICCIKAIPNITILIPVDSIETEKVIESEINRKGPCYIRLNREKTPIIYDENYEKKFGQYKFELGKAVKLREGNDLGIIATGTTVHIVLEAADILEKEGINTEVLNIHTIKPIDKNTIIETAKKTGRILTVEEHSIIGGLGSSISEILSENYPVTVKRIGVRDKFGESGEYKELLEKHGLTKENIVISTKELLNNENFY